MAEVSNDFAASFLSFNACTDGRSYKCVFDRDYKLFQTFSESNVLSWINGLIVL